MIPVEGWDAVAFAFRLGVGWFLASFLIQLLTGVIYRWLYPPVNPFPGQKGEP